MYAAFRCIVPLAPLAVYLHPHHHCARRHLIAAVSSTHAVCPSPLATLPPSRQLAATAAHDALPRAALCAHAQRPGFCRTTARLPPAAPAATVHCSYYCCHGPQRAGCAFGAVRRASPRRGRARRLTGAAWPPCARRCCCVPPPSHISPPTPSLCLHAQRIARPPVSLAACPFCYLLYQRRHTDTHHPCLPRCQTAPLAGG